MTDIEKEKIRYLRGEGLGYKAIASRLELSLGAVKGFCQRNRLDGKASQNTDGACRQCRKSLEGRQNKFCSGVCRSTWWNHHAFLREPKEENKRVCIHCGCVFHTKQNGSRKYCGHPCYIKARYGEEKSHDTGTI
jgi:hypothetical protein